MADEWFVRVQGKDYGPVDLDTLREWKREGRLIADNEVREADGENWVKAETLFATLTEAPASSARSPVVSSAPHLCANHRRHFSHLPKRVAHIFCPRIDRRDTVHSCAGLLSFSPLRAARTGFAHRADCRDCRYRFLVHALADLCRRDSDRECGCSCGATNSSARRSPAGCSLLAGNSEAEPDRLRQLLRLECCSGGRHSVARG